MLVSKRFAKWVRKRGTTKTAADLELNRVSVARWFDRRRPTRPSEDRVRRLLTLAMQEGEQFTIADLGYRLF